jgi:lipopolysaccharide export system protein LptA
MPSRMLVLLLALSVLPAAAESPPSDLFGGFSFTSRKEPIEVTSQRLDFDYKNRRTLFHGEVEVTQGDIVLRSDRLKVEYEERGDQQQLREVLAEGNVTITQGSRRATGDRAVFDETNRTLVLTGRAMLEEGSNQLNGETIIVYPDESRMEVKGEHSRVKLVIFPREEPSTEENGPGEVSPGTEGAMDGSAESP